MTKENAYRLLQLPLTANKEEVNKSFKKLAMVHHPDKGGTAKNFRILVEAKEIALGERVATPPKVKRPEPAAAHTRQASYSYSYNSSSDDPFGFNVNQRAYQDYRTKYAFSEQEKERQQHEANVKAAEEYLKKMHKEVEEMEAREKLNSAVGRVQVLIFLVGMILITTAIITGSIFGFFAIFLCTLISIGNAKEIYLFFKI